MDNLVATWSRVGCQMNLATTRMNYTQKQLPAVAQKAQFSPGCQRLNLIE